METASPVGSGFFFFCGLPIQAIQPSSDILHLAAALAPRNDPESAVPKIHPRPQPAQFSVSSVWYFRGIARSPAKPITQTHLSSLSLGRRLAFPGGSPVIEHRASSIEHRPCNATSDARSQPRALWSWSSSISWTSRDVDLDANADGTAPLRSSARRMRSSADDGLLAQQHLSLPTHRRPLLYPSLSSPSPAPRTPRLRDTVREQAIRKGCSARRHLGTRRHSHDPVDHRLRNPPAARCPLPAARCDNLPFAETSSSQVVCSSLLSDELLLPTIVSDLVHIVPCLDSDDRLLCSLRSKTTDCHRPWRPCRPSCGRTLDRRRCLPRASPTSLYHPSKILPRASPPAAVPKMDRPTNDTTSSATRAIGRCRLRANVSRPRPNSPPPRALRWPVGPP